MSILMRRRRRSRGGDGRRGNVGRAPLAALLGAVAALLLPGAAQAQSVTVDLGALDRLPPAPATPSEPVIHLHPPPAPKARRAARKEPAHRAAAPPATATSAAASQKAAGAPKEAAGAPKEAAVAKEAAAPQAPAVLPAMPQIPPAPVLPLPPDLTPVAAPAKPAVASAAPAPPARQESTAPSKAKATTARLIFAPGEADLSAEAKAELDGLATRLAANPGLRAEIDAYAAAGDASQAHRISLSRALAARGYLVERGVDVKQVDVRPLGNRTKPGLPLDRVDLVVAGR